MSPKQLGQKLLPGHGFARVDESANRSAPMFRRLAAIPIVCTAAAALFSGAGSWARGERTETWLATGTVLVILAVVLPWVLGQNRRQVLWLRTRTAAEVCRSVLALWSTPIPYEAIGPEAVPELSGVLMSLNLQKMLDRKRSEESLEQFKLRYRKERIAGQIDYFFDHAARSAAEARRYRATIMACIGLGAAVTVWRFVSLRCGAVEKLAGTWRFDHFSDRNGCRSAARGE